VLLGVSALVDNTTLESEATEKSKGDSLETIISKNQEDTLVNLAASALTAFSNGPVETGLHGREQLSEFVTGDDVKKLLHDSANPPGCCGHLLPLIDANNEILLYLLQGYNQVKDNMGGVSQSPTNLKQWPVDNQGVYTVRSNHQPQRAHSQHSGHSQLTAITWPQSTQRTVSRGAFMDSTHTEGPQSTQ
jgi:hypothetical protein